MNVTGWSGTSARAGGELEGLDHDSDSIDVSCRNERECHESMEIAMMSGKSRFNSSFHVIMM